MNPFEWEAPWIVVASGLFVVVMLRANGTYWLGRLVAAGTARTRARRVLESPGYLKASALINRWGAPVVTISFLTVGLQTLVNLGAGVTRMPLRRYLPAVILGCVAWASIYATVGVLSWQAFIAVHRRSPVLAVTGLLVLLVVLLVFVGTQVRAGRRGELAMVPDESTTEEHAAEHRPG